MCNSICNLHIETEDFHFISFVSESQNKSLQNVTNICHGQGILKFIRFLGSDCNFVLFMY